MSRPPDAGYAWPARRARARARRESSSKPVGCAVCACISRKAGPTMQSLTPASQWQRSSLRSFVSRLDSVRGHLCCRPADWEHSAGSRPCTGFTLSEPYRTAAADEFFDLTATAHSRSFRKTGGLCPRANSRPVDRRLDDPLQALGPNVTVARRPRPSGPSSRLMLAPLRAAARSAIARPRPLPP